MNDPEKFLTRWSRRKREAPDEREPPQGEAREPDASDVPSAERAADAAAPPPVADAGTAEPAFDLTKLPPIESITAETDIRAFLAPGVPAELGLAALRRAWVADPRVRDFVGLNDYDFDFHTPGAIPGFGSLEMTDDLRREVLRIVSGWQPEPEQTTPAAPAVTGPATEPAVPPVQPAAAIEETSAASDPAKTTAVATVDVGPDIPAQDQDELISAQTKSDRNKDHVAAQQENSKSENLQTLARRGHGRALPK